MEANNEQTVITRILYIRNSTTQDRKSENKKRSEARRILALRQLYEQKKEPAGTNKRNQNSLRMVNGTPR